MKWFYLLLKTPIGQEDVLKEAGLIETPGSDTYEFPPEEEQFQVNEAELLSQIDGRRAKRQNAVGFLAVAAIILLMLGAMMGLAQWFTGG